MNITYLIGVVQNKINALYNAKNQAFSMGDLQLISSIENDLLETQNTLAQLQMLDKTAKAAAAVNTTPAAVLDKGVTALQNATQGPSASAVINGYDISAYATDALYEQKIQTIISAMPAFVTVEDVDNYIQGKAVGSPVTGAMVALATKTSKVDIPLLLAIIQNDSFFGTLGIGAQTFNPGNVGNTGSATKTFGSWQEGVSAVAEWLDSHRVSKDASNFISLTDLKDSTATSTATTTATTASTTSIDLISTATSTATTTLPLETTVSTTTEQVANTSPVTATSTNSVGEADFSNTVDSSRFSSVPDSAGTSTTTASSTIQTTESITTDSSSAPVETTETTTTPTEQSTDTSSTESQNSETTASSTEEE